MSLKSLVQLFAEKFLQGWPSGSLPIAKGDSYIVNVRYGTPPNVASILHVDFYPNFGAS